MLSNLLLMLLTQAIACTPGEMSVVCHCKQGMVSACVTLFNHDAVRAARVLVEVHDADWLDKSPDATPRDFMDKLREIYDRPEMKARFPDGIT